MNLDLLLGDLLDSETWNPVGLQVIVDIPPGSKVIYPDLEGSTSRAALAVPPLGYCQKFPPPPSGTCLTSTFISTLAVNIYGA